MVIKVPIFPTIISQNKKGHGWTESCHRGGSSMSSFASFLLCHLQQAHGDECKMQQQQQQQWQQQAVAAEAENNNKQKKQKQLAIPFISSHCCQAILILDPVWRGHFFSMLGQIMQLMGDSAKDYKRRLLLAWPAVGEANFLPLTEAQVAAKKQQELLHMPQLESSSSISAGGPSVTNACAAIMPHPLCFIHNTTRISGHVNGH